MSQRRLQRTPAPESPTIGAPAVAITSVEARVAAMLTGFQPFATGASVVVAVSGGADSLCLLGALMSLRAQGRACAAGEVVVATFDHGLRGGASAADTRWVADFAGEQGLRCIVGQGDTQALARDEHRSLEDAARRLRYAFLRRIAAEVGAERICLGHTRDDQAETIILNWLRGAGLAGLAGMRPLEGDLVRPLLDVTHAETVAYCAAQGWQPREDPSNADRRFTRNRIRLELLPQLEAYNPNLRQTLARNAELLSADEIYLEAQTDAAWAQTIIEEQSTPARDGQPQRIAFDVDALLAEPLALRHRLLRRAALRVAQHADHSPEARHIALLERLLAASRTEDALDLPGGVRAHRLDNTLTLEAGRAVASDAQETPAPQDDCWELPIPGMVEIPALGWRLRAARLTMPAGLEGDTVGADVSLSHALPPVPSLPPIARAGTAAQLPHAELRVYLDAETVGNKPLRVRAWRAGDRFMPLGMAQEKKVQDYFADAKVPREMRARLPIVSSQAHILWVATQRIDERARLTPATRQIVALQCEPLATSPSPSGAGRTRERSEQRDPAARRRRSPQDGQRVR